MRTLIAFMLILTVFGLIGCGGGSQAPSAQSTPPPTPSPAPTLTPTVAPTTEPPPSNPSLERVSNTDCIAPDQPAANGDITFTAAFPNLPALSGLMGLFQAPGDNDHWYALLREGTVVRFDNSIAANSTETFIDISAQVRTRSEMGLLGLAFHPQFESNGQFYLSYNNHNDESVIAGFRFTGSLPVNTASESTLLTVEQPARNHNGGGIGFGPDNYLYIGLGDGGGANDQFNTGQDTSSLLATLLRIDVDNGSPYSIPADNPFVNQTGFAPEIFAYGLRNPWRWSFDSQTGDLWLADVGQNQYEEINIVRAGDNLGWPIMEGLHCFNSSSCEQDGLTLPIAEYGHRNGACSVTGGYVYRGQLSPSLTGQYFYADYCNGEIFRTYRNSVDEQYLSESIDFINGNVAAFAQDRTGEVYILKMNGDAGEGIYRITSQSAANTNSIPERLSETGCFQTTAPLTPAQGVVPYSINSTLWSDGADKTRYFALPNNQQIALDSSGNFLFPHGSVLIKHFFASETLLETRLLMKHNNGWAGYSYEWLPDASDAILLSESKTINAGEFEHTFPSSAQCNVCHTNGARIALGLEAGQLDKAHTYTASGLTENQLTALYTAGYLEAQPSLTQRPDIAALNDETASLNLRARSYLHTNCSGCHRPNSTAAYLDLRVQTPLNETGACNLPPINGDMNIANAQLIATGSASSSVLLARMRALDENRMPPLASTAVDVNATTVIERWINNLTGCEV